MKHLFIFFFLTANVSAQDCSTIEEKLARLDCYDKTQATENVSDEILALRAPMQERLKNPSSAQFKNETLYTNDFLNGDVLCGEVNAHNSYGAYTGFSPFISYDNQAHSIDGKNRDLVSWLCKDVSIDDFPGATITQDDSYINLARSMLSLRLYMPELAVYRNEKTKPLGRFQAACGEVNFLLKERGYIGFRKYFMTGVSIGFHQSHAEDPFFNTVYDYFCDDSTKVLSSHDDWHIMSKDDSVFVISNQDRSTLVIGCEDNQPKGMAYVPAGIFVSKDKWINSTAKEQYSTTLVSSFASKIDFTKRRNKSFFYDLASNPKSEIAFDYISSLTSGTHEFESKGFKGAINEFKKSCTDFNWKSNWENKFN